MNDSNHYDSITKGNLVNSIEINEISRTNFTFHLCLITVSIFRIKKLSNTKFHYRGISANAPHAAAVRVLLVLCFLFVSHFADTMIVRFRSIPALLAAGMLGVDV